MAARGQCPECGSEALVEDAHYAQQQLVCAACGCVLSEGLLTTTYTDEEHLREVAYSQSTGQKEQQSRCLQRGIRRVRDLCKVLQLPAAFEETAVSYLQRALQLPTFRLASLEKKELLGGCCVFVSCRQHNWPLTMGTVCSLLYARQELFASVFLSLQRELGLSVHALSLADLVTTHLSSFRLFQRSANVPTPFLEDKEQLLARTLDLVELASETWLVTGRHPVPIVTAAAFLAWKSLRPGPRLSCPLARFCRLAGVDLPPPAHLRLKELLEILLSMASQLSWLRGFRLDSRTVVKHIGDLLQHRLLLLRNAFSQQQGDKQQGQGYQDPPDQDPSGQDPPGQGCQGSQGLDPPAHGSQGQHPSGQDPPGQDSPGQHPSGQDSPGQHPSGQDSPGQDSPGQHPSGQHPPGQDPPGQDSPGQHPLGQGSASSPPMPQRQGRPWAGKGQLGGPLRPLLPPCLIHPRKRPRVAAPAAPAVALTGNEPILDSEIEQYLRSPEEIQAFRKAKGWL